MTAGVSRGSVLGPLLLMMYINNFDKGTKCKMYKFANKKLDGDVEYVGDANRFQGDLDQFNVW